MVRPLIKYPVTLFILLLVGYSQIFAHVYTAHAGYAPLTNHNGRVQIQTATTKASEIEAVYIEEEEEERISSRQLSNDNTHVTFSYAHVQAFILAPIKIYTAFCKNHHSASFFASPLLSFCVLRL